MFLQLLLHFTPALMGTVAGVRVDVTLMRVCTTILGFALIENVLRNASKADFWALKHWAIGLSGILLFQLFVRIPEFLTHSGDFSVIPGQPPGFSDRISLFCRQFDTHPATAASFPFIPCICLPYRDAGGGRRSSAGHCTCRLVRPFLRRHQCNGARNNGRVQRAGGIAAAVSSGTVRSRVRLLINEYFFAFKYDYRVEWEKVIRGLTSDLGKPDRGAGVESSCATCWIHPAVRYGCTARAGGNLHSKCEARHDRACDDVPGR